MDKYDRQVRIWSKDGQQRLQSSSILVVGASLTCTEALKDLVLAGIGNVVIVSPDQVNEPDIKGNFFLTPQSLGKNIAQEVAILLRELNPDVEIFTFSDFSEALALKSASDSTYSVALCSDRALRKFPGCLDQLQALDIPVLQFESLGFNGKIRLLAKEVCVIEPHPEPAAAVDLRFDHLWPEYRKLVDSVDLSALDDFEHAHVPFPVVLAKALQAYTGSPEKYMSSSRSVRDDFKRRLRALARSSLETNFDEALKNSWRVWREPIPEGILKLFAYQESRSQADSSEPASIFWILVAALRRFVDQNGVLPVSGIIPDMTSETEEYLKVRQIYASKADADAEQVQALASELVPIELVRKFCRNARFIQAVVPRTSGSNKPDNEILEFEAAVDYIFYGSQESTHTFGAFYKELIASHGRELPVIAALVGGLVAQEATKLVIAQYTPMFSVLLYKGGPQTTETFEENMELINS